MTKRSSNPTDAVLVAIDMSQHRQEVLIERPEGGPRRRMTVMATKADYDRLATDLSDIGRPIIVGFEATGNYHRTLAHRLLSAGFELRLISSVALARTREALHNGWDKNDSKDAQVILHMLRIGATQRYVDPLAAGINDLQEMSKTHEAISKAKTQTWHRILTHYLPLYFPEIERFAGNILINRPLVVSPIGVKLCRPSEAVLDLLPSGQLAAFAKEDGEQVVDASGQRVA